MENKVTKQEARRQYLQNGKRVAEENIDGFVVLKDICKVYGNRVQAVFDFNLSVKKNEFIVLVGPSGCGKSTTLRMIAGLEEITDGKLYIDGVLANYLESKDRDIAMVFQSYALYPNLSVYDNIAFGLQVRGLPKDEIKKRVFDAAEVLDLGSYLDRKPKELSGGQMQRVALGRAIVRDAKLFLMDEPLSNLDAKLRVQMRSEIVKLHRSIGATTIYVTHDQTEAMTMADRIVIMNKGVVQQIGSPMEVYNNPANAFVATFIGSPPMNLFNANISDNKVQSGEQKIELPAGTWEKYREYIEKRREFFAALKQKAECVEETALISEIAAAIKQIKNMPIDSAREEFLRILDATMDIAKTKQLINFDADTYEAMKADAEKNNASLLADDLRALDKILKYTELAVSGILNDFGSSNLRETKKEKQPEKKENFFKRLFSKKEAADTLQVENLKRIDEYLSAYSDPSALDNALVGIRPEDIYFDNNQGAQKEERTKTKKRAAASDGLSAPLDTEANIVELMGSDFCMHVGLFGTNIIVKRGAGEVVPVGAPVKLRFDMSKLKIFDPISGKAVEM